MNCQVYNCQERNCMYLKICNVSLYNEIQEEKKRYCPHCNKEVTVNTLLDKKNWFINRGIFKKRV